MLYIAYKPKGGKLKLLYVLVPRIKAITAKRHIRNNYDNRLPQLQAQINTIVTDAMVDVYNRQFKDALDSINGALQMRTPPKVLETAALHASRLVPRY